MRSAIGDITLEVERGSGRAKATAPMARDGAVKTSRGLTAIETKVAQFDAGLAAQVAELEAQTAHLLRANAELEDANRTRRDDYLADRKRLKDELSGARARADALAAIVKERAGILRVEEVTEAMEGGDDAADALRAELARHADAEGVVSARGVAAVLSRCARREVEYGRLGADAERWRSATSCSEGEYAEMVKSVERRCSRAQQHALSCRFASDEHARHVLQQRDVLRADCALRRTELALLKRETAPLAAEVKRLRRSLSTARAALHAARMQAAGGGVALRGDRFLADGPSLAARVQLELAAEAAAAEVRGGDAQVAAAEETARGGDGRSWTTAQWLHRIGVTDLIARELTKHVHQAHAAPGCAALQGAGAQLRRARFERCLAARLGEVDASTLVELLAHSPLPRQLARLIRDGARRLDGDDLYIHELSRITRVLDAAVTRHELAA